LSYTDPILQSYLNPQLLKRKKNARKKKEKEKGKKMKAQIYSEWQTEESWEYMILLRKIAK
jgi:hypothetical protein